MSKRNGKKCCVPECKSKESPADKISFHKFAKNDQRRKHWLKLLKMKSESITKHTLVCSKHFQNHDFFVGFNRSRRDLKCTAIPSLHLPVTLITERRKNLAAVKEREMRAIKRSLKREEVRDMKIDENIPGLKRSTDEKNNILSTGKRSLSLLQLQVDGTEIQDTAMRHASMKMDVENSKKSVGSGIEECSMCRGTGIIDKSNRATKFMIDKAVQAGEENCNKSTQTQENYILSNFLDTKLKLNLSFACLAILFKITRQTCTYDFYAMLTLLNAVLSGIIRWPPKNEIFDNMPKCFKSFPSTRVILDGTEIPIQKRKCLKCKISTYSHYKSGHTVKFILGITPSGLISFVSEAYGGRASDKQIVVESGILDKLTPIVDSVMCDKGILIDAECRKRKLKLIMPFVKRKNKQFSAKQSNINQQIASARVHVERCIQRIQIFKILKGPLSWDMVPWSPEIMRVICGIVNLSPPILKEDKFL